MIGLDLPWLFYFTPESGFGIDGADPAPGKNWLGECLTVVPAWSVGAEIWFYLMAPWFVRQSLPVVCAALAASLGLRLWMDIHTGFSAYYFFPAQLAWFAAGVVLHRFYASRFFRPLAPPLAWGWAALLATMLACYSRVDSPLKALFLFPVAGGFIPYLFHLTRQMRLDRRLGELSYPMYLLHEFAEGVIRNVFHASSGGLCVLLTLALSMGVNRWIERPIDRYRQKRVVAKPKGPNPVSPAP
jgi:peptidoglycan/LPS O-acetylase OafA/YrhL